MSERSQGDTPEPATASRIERERQPGNYYYDDGKGYQVYDPIDDKEDENENNQEIIG